MTHKSESSDARAAYEEACREAFATHRKELKAADAAFYKEKGRGLAAYEAAVAAYRKATDMTWAAYGEAIAEARAAYDKALAAYEEQR